MTDDTIPGLDDAGALDTVLSLGAGVQSSALALMLANGDLDLAGVDSRAVLKRKAGDRLLVHDGPLNPPRLAIFADTGWEPAEVYDHLARLEAALAAAPHPIEVLRVSAGNIRDDTVGRIDGERGRYANLPIYIVGDGIKTRLVDCGDCGGTGVAPDDSLDAGDVCGACQGDGIVERVASGNGVLRRQCTREYKLDPLKARLRELGYGPGRHVASLVGISLDELRRVKPGEGWQHRAHPLIERRLTRTDCKTYLRRHGWDAPRSACIGCPYHSNAEWRRLRDTAPDEFADAVAFDETIRDSLPGLVGRAYLHRDRIPLADVNLDTREDLGQSTLFDDECEGICGV